MKAVRFDISAYTASFRLPGIMGYQATSPVPPPSTIFGLLSAAVGRDLSPLDLEWIAYRFSFDAHATDLEKIIAFGPKGPFYDSKLGGVNTVPIKREFLFNPKLVLYLPPNTLESAMERPRYPLCLGRSQDIAAVDKIMQTELHLIAEAGIEGVLVPFPAIGNVPSSSIQSFPTCMQPVIPRTPQVVRLFHVVTRRQNASTKNLYMEPEEELAVPLLTRQFLLGSGVE